MGVKLGILTSMEEHGVRVLNPTFQRQALASQRQENAICFNLTRAFDVILHILLFISLMLLFFLLVI
jgi:hypothetical protein